MNGAALDVFFEVGDLIFHLVKVGDEARVTVGSAQGAVRFLAERGELVHGFGEGGELKTELIGLFGERGDGGVELAVEGIDSGEKLGVGDGGHGKKGMREARVRRLDRI